MPMQIVDPELESKLVIHSQHQAVPPTKTRLSREMLWAMVQAAESQGVNIASIINDLRRPKKTPRPKTRTSNIARAT